MASAALLGAGVVHAAQVEAHLQEWPLAGLFFASAAVLQVALGAVLLLRKSLPVVLSAVGLSGTLIAVWLISRTAGIPFGPHAGIPEIVGPADIVATAFAATAIAALTPSVVGTCDRRKDEMPARSRRRWFISVVGAGVVVMVSALALRGAPVCEPETADVNRGDDGGASPLALLESHHRHDPYRLQLEDAGHPEEGPPGPASGTATGAACHRH